MSKHGTYDRIALALSAPDEAFRKSEAKWGVARLERLVSPTTLASYRRGWVAYRKAIDDGDADAVEQIAPKMIQALQFMSAEAEAAGHQPLSVTRWEASLDDGRVLVVVRTLAEAHAIARDKSDDRRLSVYTLAEIARLLPTLEITHAVKTEFPGSEVIRVGKQPVVSGVQTTEGQLSDWATAEPLHDLLHA